MDNVFKATTLLFVFEDGFGNVDLAYLRGLLGLLIFHFKQMLFMYVLQLEHQVFEVLLRLYCFILALTRSFVIHVKATLS